MQIEIKEQEKLLKQFRKSKLEYSYLQLLMKMNSNNKFNRKNWFDTLEDEEKVNIDNTIDI